MVLACWIAIVVALCGGVALWIDRRRLLREAAQSARRVCELEAMAYVDELTEAGNRRLFAERLTELVAHTLRAGEPLGLLAVDLNGLKTVNDTRGHPVGDRVIRAAAEVLKNSVRPTDHVCRIGGDEFSILLPSCAAEGLRVVAIRIVENFLATHVLDEEAQIPVRASVGGTVLTVRGGNAYVGELDEIDVGLAMSRSTLERAVRVLVESGDAALYDAKSRKAEEGAPCTLR